MPLLSNNDSIDLINAMMLGFYEVRYSIFLVFSCCQFHIFSETCLVSWVAVADIVQWRMPVCHENDDMNHHASESQTYIYLLHPKAKLQDLSSLDVSKPQDGRMLTPRVHGIDTFVSSAWSEISWTNISLRIFIKEYFFFVIWKPIHM